MYSMRVSWYAVVKMWLLDKVCLESTVFSTAHTTENIHGVLTKNVWSVKYG